MIAAVIATLGAVIVAIITLTLATEGSSPTDPQGDRKGGEGSEGGEGGNKGRDQQCVIYGDRITGTIDMNCPKDAADDARSSSGPTPTRQSIERPATASGEPSPSDSPSLHHSGVIEALGDKDGVDLDNGRVKGQNAPGVDISFYGRTSHIGAMAETVEYAILPSQEEPEHDACERAAGWYRVYDDVYNLSAGRAICVRTSERRLAMMVIEKPAGPDSGTIGFRYFTW